ncbi:MAG: hypothetical protein RSB74_06190, partial [Kiritimatiellia bacterium]
MTNSAKTALLCAYTLAKAERYVDAEELILSDVELAKTVEAMDLLARIRAEQGDVNEARRLWQEIQSIHPEYLPATRALNHLGKKPRGGSRCHRLTLVLSALAVGIVIGIFIYASGTPRIHAETIVWNRFPCSADFTSLAPYKGKVERLSLSSRFFAEKGNSRAVLTSLLSTALNLSPHAIYIAGSTQDAITLELTL